jgi:transposase
MAKRQRQFSAEYKAQLVLEMLTGKRTVAEMARTEKIKDTLLYRWRAEALEKLPVVFSVGRPDQAQNARVQELEQLIGQLTIENQALKKASRWLSGLSHKGGRS